MKRFLLCLSVLVLVGATGSARSLGGVTLPETLKAGDTTLVLNGAGLRKKLWIKVYAGGLYLKAKSSDARSIIHADEPMAVRMHFIYDGVSAKKLINGWNEGFEAATHDNPSAIQTEINQFNSLFTKEAKEGDVYDIIYVPGTGTTVYLNGTALGTVPGLAFKQALFAIWLGDEPADDGLKEGMLNQE